MGLADWWYTFRKTRMSKPAEERAMYQATQGRQFRSVLEVGVGDGSRALRLVDWLQRQADGEIRYAAIDMFEAGEGPALKSFHAQMGSVGAKPLPIPGTLASGLPRVAHTLGAVDLVLFSFDIPELTGVVTQNFLPRIIESKSVVLLTDDESGALYALSGQELLDDLRSEHLAAAA